MAKAEKLQITFGEFVYLVYKSASEWRDVEVSEVAPVIENAIDRGIVRFSNPSAVADLIQEID
jgi:hypothetical protein